MTDTSLKMATSLRLTSLSPGGGCSCKVSPGELEALLSLGYGGLSDKELQLYEQLRCAKDSGDDATAIVLDERRCLITTTDFFPPVVDDPFDFGRIAAANALSDVYAMGGEPLSALNLLCWPDGLSYELAAEILRGGRAVAAEAECLLFGGHSIVDATPKYGLAVTGVADLSHLLRNDAARAGDAITLTKPLGLGILNNRHKQTGEVFEEAVATMATLNRAAARAARARSLKAATDVTGFGLLGHLYKMARASGVSALVEAAAVPYLEGARSSLAAGYVPGGSLRNLSWVRDEISATVPEDELVLLADAQTSGGLIVAGELDGYAIIGSFVPKQSTTLLIR